MLYKAYRYSQWDGTQELFDMDADEVLDQLSNELFQHGDMWRALRDMMRQGMQDRSGQQMPGMQRLMEQLRNQRREQLQQYNMDSVMDDLKEKLKEIIQTERQGIDKRLDQAREQTEAWQQIEADGGAEREQYESLYKMLEQRAQSNTEKLDALPDSAGGQIQELMEYDFMDPDAQQMFQELLDMLRQQMAHNMGQQMAQSLQNMSPEQQQGMQDMLRDLNQMLRDQMAGRQPDFDGFMEKYGPMFGDNPPQSLEELMEMMSQQMSQMQSMMDSMSPEARQELEDALNSSLDPGLQQELSQLAQLMGQMMPIDDMRREYPFLGDDSLTMDQAMQLMGQLQGMDQLEQAIQDALRTGDLDQVDLDKLAETLGEEARRTWEQLQQLMKALKEAGYITDENQPDLTARGVRKIAQKALKEVFAELKKDRVGTHELDTRGSGGDAIFDTKPYEFGDPFNLDLHATVKNSIVRTGPQVPLKLTPDDFEIFRNEHMTRTSTVVLLDQSRSMGMAGAWVAAKKVAMALFALIHTQYPRDVLHIVGFSDYAREITEEDLPKLTWNSWTSGTNLHHALLLSRRLLSRDKGGSRQIIVITDGEPTAHLEGDQSYFSYPPSPRTITETMKEAKRCTQEGIVINTFMLENNYQLMNFVDQITRINRGRAFYSSPDHLGEYVLVDYVTNRKKSLAT